MPALFWLDSWHLVRYLNGNFTRSDWLIADGWGYYLLGKLLQSDMRWVYCLFFVNRLLSPWFPCDVYKIFTWWRCFTKLALLISPNLLMSLRVDGPFNSVHQTSGRWSSRMSIPHPAILSNVSSLSIRFPAGHCIIGSLGNPHQAWLLLMLLDVEVLTCAQLLELLTISTMAEHFNLFVIVTWFFYIMSVLF